VVPEDDLTTAFEVSRAQSSCASCDVVKVAFGLAALLSVLLNFAVVRWMFQGIFITPGIAWHS
jgi:nitrate reductase NapE component